MKKIFLRIISLGVFLSLFLSTNAFCSSLTSMDVQNKEVEFSKLPERIISLVPSITEELYLLGIQKKIVGCTTYCTRPENAKTKEKVATAVEVNLEKVIALQPEVIFATSFTDLEAIQKLKTMGIEIVKFSQPKDFIEICGQFVKIGQIVGKEDEAKEIVSDARRGVDKIKTKIGKMKRPKVFVQVGAKPLFTITKDSFINDLIELAGGINVAKNAQSGIFNREEVLKLNPDYIIVVTMGIVGEDEKRIWQRFEHLNAVKSNNIFIVDSSKVCSPTPLTFVEILEEFVSIFYPNTQRK